MRLVETARHISSVPRVVRVHGNTHNLLWRFLHGSASRNDPIRLVVPEFLRSRCQLLNALLDLGSLVRGCCAVGIHSPHGISRDPCALLLLLKMLMRNLLVMLVDDLSRHTLHAKDFDIEALAARIGIFHMRERLFVHLVHVDGQAWHGVSMILRQWPAQWPAQTEDMDRGELTTCRVEAPPASVAFEMLGLLM